MRRRYKRIQAFEAKMSGQYVPARYRGRVRSRQIDRFRKILPYSLTASAANAFIVFCVLFQTEDKSTLCFWLATILLLSIVGLKTGKKISSRPYRSDRMSAAKLARPYIESVLVGCAWGVAPAFFLPAASDAQLAVLITVGAGMMAGGAYTMSPIPRAAGIFVTMFTGGLFIGFLLRGHGAEYIGLMCLLVCYAIIMFRASYWNYGSHLEVWLNQFKLEEQAAELEQQKDVISVLLKDFEESASDIFIEFDADGRLVNVSADLAALLQTDIQQLEATTIWDLFQRAKPCQREAIDEIIANIKSERAFSSREIHHQLMGEEQVLCISAKPLYTNGKYSGHRGVISDLTETYTANARIAYMAHYDALTDLPNRSFFNETLERCLYAQKADDETFCVIALDLDLFKAVNDAHGHDLGDLLLRRVSDMMKACLQANDFVARMGGDEFAIIQRDVKTRRQTMALCDHLIETLSQPMTIKGINVQIGVSLGVAFCPFDTVQASELLKFADLALYRAKEDGRNCVRYFHQDMDDQARERRQLEADLKSALTSGEFKLHYQPLIDTNTSKVVSYEALLRWEHPTRGLVSPDEFISVCEQSGLILAIGEWVMRTAVHEVASWPTDAKVSVNLSPLQVKQKGLVAAVTQALASSGLQPSRLEFEITESVLLDDGEEAMSRLKELQALGVSIALDDFGTGYASLSYLRMFKFNKVKIDRSFVHAMGENLECWAIVQAVTNLAKTLDIRSTAEGVETVGHVETLRGLGVSELQGYYFSRAQSPADLIANGFLEAVEMPETDGNVTRIDTHKRKRAIGQDR